MHPREVDAAFAHGKTRNWFGGSSNASTQLLDDMHYRGMLRIARREGGVRPYAAREPVPGQAGLRPTATAAPQAPTSRSTIDPDAAMDTLVDVIVGKYAPLPERSGVSRLGSLTPLPRAPAPPPPQTPLPARAA